MTLGINILIDGISIMNNTDKNKFDHSKDCRLPTAFQKKVTLHRITWIVSSMVPKSEKITLVISLWQTYNRKPALQTVGV